MTGGHVPLSPGLTQLFKWMPQAKAVNLKQTTSAFCVQDVTPPDTE
jgi:hypothetical protein